MVSKTTDNLECLPSVSSSVVIKKEHPCKCYQRIKQMDTTTRVDNDSEYKFLCLTTDTRFAAKYKAVFSFLDVPTKIVCCKPDYILETLDEIISDLNESQDQP